MKVTLEDFLNLQMATLQNIVTVTKYGDTALLLTKLRSEGFDVDSKNVREINGEVVYRVRLVDYPVTIHISLVDASIITVDLRQWCVQVFVDRFDEVGNRKSIVSLSRVYGDVLGSVTEKALDNAKPLLDL